MKNYIFKSNTRQKCLVLATAMLVLGASSCSLFKRNSQKKPEKNAAVASAPKPKADSLKTAVKPYATVITAKAITQSGLMIAHKVAERYFFEIPKKLLNKEILVVNRLSGSTPGAGNFAGEEVGKRMIYWEQGPDQKLFLRVSALVSVADSSDMISNALVTSIAFFTSRSGILKLKKGKRGNT
jgi:hypothetical protein